MCYNKNNFVSIIIPVYNDQEGINTCLKALSFQSYPKSLYQVIVVDNDSFPPLKIPPAYSRFTKLLNCRTPGSYAARNVGIREASGDILAFTDADCIPDRDWIRNGTTALIQSPKNLVVGGNVVLLPSREPGLVEQYQLITGFRQQENIERKNFVVTANLFACKSLFSVCGLFEGKLLSGGDREWCWRAVEHGIRIRYTPEAVVFTFPRTTLISAIRQARRVAGGRYFLKKMKSPHISFDNIKRDKNLFMAVKWLFKLQDLSVVKKWQLLLIAGLIRITHMMETVRLSFKLKPERR